METNLLIRLNPSFLRTILELLSKRNFSKIKIRNLTMDHVETMNLMTYLEWLSKTSKKISMSRSTLASKIKKVLLLRFFKRTRRMNKPLVLTIPSISMEAWGRLL